MDDEIRDLERRAAAGDPEARDQVVRARERAGWPGLEVARDALLARLRAAYPTEPVPPYPAGLGLDPAGEDEYADFAGVPWDALGPDLLERGYDISPWIGFKGNGHIWNYYLPGLMRATLVGECDCDGFLWQLREESPPESALPPSSFGRPWWHSASFYRRYTKEQLACVVRFVEFFREFGAATGYEYEWEEEDEAVYQRWRSLRSPHS